ncbi:MAG TPA: glycerophosphodiester phosphodiesterase family protein [Pyrinomonadaceae bacterium]|nr:glycerophosphodiester phosphodiesterase family protein [Pyrinomonadaceae bacterium]HLE64415.1 glycerophosphodiester phosphodiesterase family protein [Pyrinomonadaceae bacterium]
MTLPRRYFIKLLGSAVVVRASHCLTSTSAKVRTTSKNATTARKILVAHRGASAYAPEHTLEAYQLALEQGADFVEQDLQITRDSALVCLHDLTLERTTNVREMFPKRFREELVSGSPARRWYVSDFSLEELKQLDAGSWFDTKFKDARIPTFQEAIDLVRGKAGLYPETKAPEVYGGSGFDMERLLLSILKRNRLDQPNANHHTPVIIQSFSPEGLRKLAGTLKTKLPLVLLVSDEAPTSWLTMAGLPKVTRFASGIGPAKALVDKSLVTQAHALGLSVTPYTFRSSNTGRFKTVREEMNYYLYSLGVDAVFTDNPDLFPRAPINPRQSTNNF